MLQAAVAVPAVPVGAEVDKVRHSRASGAYPRGRRAESASATGGSDDAETIGAALGAAGRGRGHRSIAKRLGRPATTVRGWLRAAVHNAEALRTRAMAVQAMVEQETEWLRPASPLGVAMTALVAAAAAAKRLFGAGRCATSLWEFIVVVNGGRLLRPTAAAQRLNPTAPFPGSRPSRLGDTMTISATFTVLCYPCLPLQVTVRNQQDRFRPRHECRRHHQDR